VPELVTPRPVRWELFILAELTALCGLAVAQPLLDVTGRAPDFFLFNGAGFADILLLIAVIVVAPPLLLWGLGVAGWLGGRRVRRAVHLLTVGALCAALAVHAGKWLLPVRGVPLVLLAAAAGAACAAGYARWSAVPTLLRVAAAGPLVFVLLFVFVSPSSALILGGPQRSSGPGQPTGTHPPLVVIFFDEFPQLSLLDDNGDIDAKRFPNFAALAGDSTWYRNATAVRGFTPYAVPSMLTGRFPTRQAAPHYSQYPDNLFTLLAGTYDFKVQESLINLCPPELCGGARPPDAALPELLGHSAGVLRDLLSPVDASSDPEAGFAEPTAKVDVDKVATFLWSQKRSDNQPLRFQDFVADLRPSPRPTLHLLHLLLPHRPLRYLPSGDVYAVPSGLPKTGEWWARLSHQRHLLQAQYADRLLGEALQTMRSSGLYDDATVVVTADHGIAFTPKRNTGRHILKSQDGAAQIGWVPLFIKAPDQTTARTDMRNWLHIDLLPTLADYAGVAVPYQIDGISALRQERASADKPFTWDYGRPLMLDPGTVAQVLAGPDDAITVPDAPRPDLVGRAVADMPVKPTGLSATVSGLAAFQTVGQGNRPVPAVVYGTVPDSVAAGETMVIALNGTIAATVPVLPPRKGEPRFGGVIADANLYRPGANRLELFLLDVDQRTLRQLRL
jgi:hypothetical protein